jgi:outer membrane receptor for ferrienterochelin and colicins
MRLERSSFTRAAVAVVVAALSCAMLAERANAQRGQGVIVGRVTDAASGRPLANARVDLVAAARDTQVAGHATTAADGRYVLRAAAAGSFVVRVTFLGYVPGLSGRIQVGSNDTITVTLALEPLGPILDPTVVTVSRTEERASAAPATVSVVDARTIEEQPTVTPVEHAREAPGVDIATTGIIQSHIVTRGFNGVFSGAMLVLTDYRFDAVPSLRVNTPWLIPATNSDIDRLEVVLGPAAALYGPNAASGVLQIFTKSPFDSPGATVSATGLFRSGNASGPAGSGQQIGLRSAGTIGSRFGYKVTGQYLTGTDWREQDSVEAIGRRSAIGAGFDSTRILLGRRDFGVSRWSAGGELDFRPNETTEAVIAAGRTQAGSAIELTGVGAVQVRDWKFDYYQARVRSGSLFAQLFLNANDAGNTYFLRSGSPVVDQSRMLVGQLQYASEFGARETLTYGVDGQRTDPRTGGTIDGRNENNDTIDEVGGYAQSETHISPRVDFLAAARVDRNNRLSSAVFSPRAAILFRATDDQILRLTYNRAFETPTAQDLFSDFPVLIQPDGLPLIVRSVGVPSNGFTFSHDCGAAAGGLCMQSAYTQGRSTPIDATAAWNGAVQLAKAAGWGDLTAIPAPSAAQVASVMRLADISSAAPRFLTVSPNDVQNVPALRPTVTNALEAGYKGRFGDDLRLMLDVYYEWRKDFIGPPQVITPSVFLDATTLAAYLGQYMPAAQATQIATLIGGVAGSAATPGLPLGTVAPGGLLGGSPDVLATYRNFGTLHRVGSDVAAQWRVQPSVTLSGAYSWTNKVLWAPDEVGGISEVALNAPANRATLAAQYRSNEHGYSTYLRARYSGAFPMNSGVYVGDVSAYTLVDAGGAYRLPRRPDMLLTLSVLNLLNDVHREFVGAPAIGRLAMLQLDYTLR